MNTARAEEKIADALARIRGKFLARLEIQIDEFLLVLARLESGEYDRGNLKSIGREIHKTSGIARSVGFSDLGDASFRVEQEIQALLDSADPSPDLQALIRELKEFAGLCCSATQHPPASP